MRLRVVFLLLSVILCCPHFSAGQQVQLVLQRIDSAESKNIIIENKTTPSLQSFDNAMDAYDALKKLIAAMQDNGYLAASVDTLVLTETKVEAFIFQGPKYQWARLSFDSIPTALLIQMNIREREWSNRPVNAKQLSALSEIMLNYCENNGYPFAYTTLRNIKQEDKGLSADFILERGRLTRFDSLSIESDADISREYLQHYLGIKQGDLYNETQLRLVNKRLNELAFLQPSKPWRMDFTVGGNTLYLYLKEKKSNQLNGLIGLQPNTAATGKFLLTADILLGLKNALGYGETIAATYQNLQYKSPRFHLETGIPYLIGTPVGFDGSFDLFKKDTTFYRTTFDLGFKYQLNASDFFKLAYQAYSNHLINADTDYVIENKKLPDNLDISTKGAVFTFNMDRTDYRLNPRKGWQASFSGSGLLRTVKTNDAIANIDDGTGYDYKKLYDSANVEKYQYRFAAVANYYITPLKNFVIKIAYNGGYISGKNLFLNELYQLGGFKLLRGFDEQSIYANLYHVGTLEFRFLLSRNSYFYLFSDASIIQADYNGGKRKDNPVSLGGGITLENKSGIFNIALGLGKTSGNDFQFKQTKIHFGYTAYF
ncbi:BamA/TamA family outer membrane protein [Taibaiella lutea]|uniref:BamA/TamA family outer membrane protein n=1 Tax=Taibaiella lutea TaxID=2608001 RepID=A0A5M6CS38_9BACT|nr:BamA/TamA family outer membrane protein [Taibaiella lutea]KAA5536772.1 BamA/TamA family outer membrane protein [Taibaiella lutea]